jgi:hypothetical protein
LCFFVGPDRNGLLQICKKDAGRGTLTVGTHKDRAYVGKVTKVIVPTVKVKDTSAVSLKTAAGGEQGDRRAAHPCSPVKVRRSYARALKG